MKHHVHTLILLASLTITWLLCSCRTTYQKDRSAQEQSNLSISDSTLYDRTGDFSYGMVEPEISTPDSTSIRKKPIKVGRSKSTSTHRKLQIRLPAYPRYRISRLRGARRISKPCYKKMTLYTYLRSKRRKLISRFSKTAN